LCGWVNKECYVFYPRSSSLVFSAIHREGITLFCQRVSCVSFFVKKGLESSKDKCKWPIHKIELYITSYPNDKML